ncbi:MAG: sulfite exporter TauE/SafE family protein [Thermodesulfobacteriota bacterium]
MQGATLYAMLAGFGVLVGIGASFSGLGGGFLMVPLLLFMGYSAQKAVGTSFLAILVISVSALLAHNKLSNVNYQAGIFLGLGGVVGAQVGARLVEHISTSGFKKVFAFILVGLAAYLFLKK